MTLHGDFDVIIVGVGPAGLRAAQTTIDAGRSGVLRESPDRPGGRLHSNNFDGFDIDDGF